MQDFHLPSSTSVLATRAPRRRHTRGQPRRPGRRAPPPRPGATRPRPPSSRDARWRRCPPNRWPRPPATTRIQPATSHVQPATAHIQPVAERIQPATTCSPGRGASATWSASASSGASRSVRTTDAAPAVPAARPTAPSPQPSSRTRWPSEKDGTCASRRARATEAGQTTSPAPYRCLYAPSTPCCSTASALVSSRRSSASVGSWDGGGSITDTCLPRPRSTAISCGLPLATAARAGGGVGEGRGAPKPFGGAFPLPLRFEFAARARTPQEDLMLMQRGLSIVVPGSSALASVQASSRTARVERMLRRRGVVGGRRPPLGPPRNVPLP